ncbi:DUF2336 domain-containing protein [Roseibium sp.]|uniref:DUF2336 domain-containing protein n=1 Tax=Roseibium sp. TaxID=1936156 RepID=UPI003A983DE9
MFYQLLDLAKENSAEARGALLLGLADILVHDIEKRSQEELNMFGEIAVLLYPSSPKSDRVQLSRKVSDEPRTPVALAMELASDQISIAMPVLENFTAFGTKNLLALAKKLGDDHLQVLARRTDLETEVSDTLVRRGNRSVHRILAGNREIRLSHTALRALVRHAVQDVVLREDLALRKDLTPTVCNMLMPHVSKSTQVRLQKLVRGALTKADLDKLARLRELRRTHGSKIDQLEVKDLWPYAKAKNITFNELIILMLQDERLAHVADLIGLQSRVQSNQARNAVFKGQLDQVISMAQKANLTTDVFALLAKARCKHLRIPSSQAAEWIKAFVTAKAPQAPKAKTRPLRGGGEFAAKRPQRPKRENGRRFSAI